MNAPSTTSSTPTRSTLLRLGRGAWRLWRVRLGAGSALTIILIAIFGPLLTPHDPTEFIAPPFAPISDQLLFGADYLGRDVLSRFLAGGRSLLSVAIPATLLGVGVGGALGLTAAVMKSAAGETIMRLLDAVLAFPQVVLALLFLTIIGPQPWLLTLVVALAHAPQSARVIKGAATEVVERDFIRAAEIIGMPRRTIVQREVLPNVSGQVLVELGLRLTYSIAIVAALSFLGFGRQPPDPDWGLMINENKIALVFQPWGTLLPVIAISLLTVGVNLVADGIARVSARISAEESGT